MKRMADFGGNRAYLTYTQDSPNSASAQKTKKQPVVKNSRNALNKILSFIVALPTKPLLNGLFCFFSIS